LKSSNILQLLEKVKESESIGVTLIENNQADTFISYKKIYEGALIILGFLQEKGIKPKQELIFQVENNYDFIIIFWACALGGIIPIPLSLTRTIDHYKKLVNVWEVLNEPFLITSIKHLEKIEKFSEEPETSEQLLALNNKFIDTAEMLNSNFQPTLAAPDKDDIAYIQFSSGSTGAPKGVMVSHENLLANIEAIIKGIHAPASGDTFFSWMPLTHDMGLIGFHLTPLFAGWNHYIMPTDLFVRRPSLWLDKISEYKLTFTASPNFGYSYVLSRCGDNLQENWDLSSLRVIVNGAEPISAELAQRFTKRFGQCKLKENVIFPVYGLAEASLAVTFTNPLDEVLALNFSREHLNYGDEVQEAETGISFVSVGKPIKYCSIRISDSTGIPFPNNTIGNILIKGQNVTKGYYNNEAVTSRSFVQNEWLDTGDLGFMKGENLFVTGRAKDILFVNGQNFYAHDIEFSLEKMEGIDLGKVAVGGLTNAITGLEEIIVFIYFKGKIEKFVDLIKTVKQTINQKFGFEPHLVLPTKVIPKTTSGKVQRFKLVQMYEDNHFDEVILEINQDNVELDDAHTIIQPGTPYEIEIHAIWVEVLNKNHFGMTDKFFDLGGSSLKAAQVLTALNQSFKVDLSYDFLYERQTIQEVALVLEKMSLSTHNDILKVDGEPSVGLSPAQEQLYFLWELDKTSVAYNIPFALQTEEVWNMSKLEKSVQTIVERHDILRTSFYLNNGAVNLKRSTISDMSIALSTIDSGNINEELKNRVQSFDLINGPLFRIEILKISETKSILFIDFHHIIADGVSIGLFIDELMQFYRGETVPQLDIQYVDYLHWANQNRESYKLNKQKTYWLNQFKQSVPVLNLPTDYQRPALIDYKGEKLEFKLNKDLTSKLKSLAKNNNTTLFTVLLASYVILISKYAGQEDVVVGIPVARRNHQQIQPLIGMFVNNLATRHFPLAELSLAEFLDLTKIVLKDAINNQDFNYKDLIDEVEEQRDFSRNSLFDTMFVYQNMELKPTQAKTFQRHFFDHGISKYDISFEVFHQEDEVKYYIEYATSLFKNSSIERIASYYEHILDNMIASPTIKISKFSLLGDTKFKKEIVDFNDTATSYPNQATLHQLIEEQVRKNPNKIAVSHQRISDGSLMNDAVVDLTYGELNKKASQFANVLRSEGVTNDQPVAVIMNRSTDLVVAILAILKSGGCYLPIDKELPHNRVKYIIEDSKCEYIILSRKEEQRFDPTESLGIKTYDITDQQLLQAQPETIANTSKPKDLAYVIYTSGTTGNPKGVMVEHQSIVNYISYANATYVRNEEVVFPLYTSISFDLTLTSIFAPLVGGNSIIVYANEFSLEDVLQENKVQILKATPSHLKLLKDIISLMDDGYKSNIQLLIVGGEEFTTALAKELQELLGEGLEIYNEYGPTESTVGCIVHLFNLKEDTQMQVPIGTPINNTQSYLLDEHLNPVAIGAIGELYVSGDSLARGYLYKPDLTAQKYVDNPFIPGARMYRTGDVAKKLESGDLEYIGRVDQQVKINGYRIELGEIESVILRHDEVENVLIAVKSNDTSTYLNAYIIRKAGNVLQDKRSFDMLSQLQILVASTLPPYMVPQSIIEIESFPLTKNGKVNYDLLPETAVQTPQMKLDATNELEALMLKIWKEVLNENEIGIQDNFIELGGDSIKAVQITSRLFEENIKIKVKDILKFQTIKKIAEVAQVKDASMQHEQGVIDGTVPLTPIQNWFFNQQFNNPNFFNQSVLLQLNENASTANIQRTFEILIEHHDGLRLNFNPELDCMFYNNSTSNAKNIVSEYSIENKPLNDAEIQDQNTIVLNEEILNILQSIKASLDIQDSLLLKVVQIKYNAVNLLFITAHHLIMDGVSWRILLEDFRNVYEAVKKDNTIKLPLKTASLIDCSKKLSEFEAKVNPAELEFWGKNQSTNFKIIDEKLSRDSQIKDLQKVNVQLNRTETKFLLKESHKAYNSTPEILLITALLITLKDWSKQDQIVLELENYGRHYDDVDVTRTIGWFTTMYPLLFNLSDANTGGQIKMVKERLSKVQKGGIYYGIHAARETQNQHAPVRFNYLGQFESETDNELFSLVNTDLGAETDVRNHFTTQIDVNAIIVKGRLTIAIGYNCLEFSETFMNEFARNYQVNLSKVLDHIKSEETVHFTPSDFKMAQIDESDLNSLFN
jgi:amino acid adenylation domain-containing protein/non-ribosomal peptide synthase protein (TIGR01720 family)